MNTYTVKSTDGTYNIIADNWSVGHEGLKFYQKEKMVAWFTTWDFWMCESEDFETGLDEIAAAYKIDKYVCDPYERDIRLRNLVYAITRHILGVEDED